MFRKIFKIVFSIIVIIIPIVLLILPANFFDQGESLCLSKSLLNMECLGCGITRAIQHLLHFDFSEAWLFNKLSFIILPIFIFLWIKEVAKTYKLLKK